MKSLDLKAGSVAPNLSSTREALDLVIEAINISGYKPGDDVSIALDVAASEFYKDGMYTFENSILTGLEMIEFYKNLLNDYPIVSIEDPFAEEDWEHFSKFTAQFGDKLQIVGDDLYVTNTKRLEKGIELKASNAILIKLNQIGTLTETLNTIKLAQENGYNPVISHCSGETGDTSISDLSVAVGAKYIKNRRTSSKYNQLLRIEEDILG